MRKVCDALNVSPVAVLNTHSHADHYGGNDYLLRQFEMPVYAPAFEAGILQNPYLEPVYLFNGAKPLPELMSKWLLAKPSRVDVILEPGTLELVGLPFEILDTSGHAHQHVSVKVGDVLIAADAVFGAAVLGKYPLPFGQDIGGQIEECSVWRRRGLESCCPVTVNRPKRLKTSLPTISRHSSAPPTWSKRPASGFQRKKFSKRSVKRWTIEMLDLPRFYLNRCVVTAYLSYLRDEGRVEVALRENSLTWRRL